MSLFSYPTNGLVSTIAPAHHSCILQLHLTSSLVFISWILSACLSLTVSFYQDPCILHLHPTISHVCNICIQPFPMSLTVASNQQSYLLTCDYKHAGLIHLHQTNTHICYSNIKPSVLSVALETHQRSSNGCYYCTGQASSQDGNEHQQHTDPYSGVIFCVVTIHSIRIVVNFKYPSS